MVAGALRPPPNVCLHRHSRPKGDRPPPGGNGADPDGKSADMTKPVQVFILLGQSNMLGFGKVGPAGKNGSLEHAVKTKKLYPYLADGRAVHLHAVLSALPWGSS